MTVASSFHAGRLLRLRDVMSLAQDHTASQWQSWISKPKSALICTLKISPEAS